MKKLNYSAEQIKKVYQYGRELRGISISEFEKETGLKLKPAYGHLYLHIEQIFTDEPNQFEYKYVGYGGLNFLGNINGKTSHQLYYKNEEIKRSIERLVISLSDIFDGEREALEVIHKDHGKPNIQHAILAHF